MLIGVQGFKLFFSFSIVLRNLHNVRLLSKILLFWVANHLICSAGPGDGNLRDTSTAQAKNSDRHVLLMVWDGMRPDFLTEANAPNLWKLAQSGVLFRNHHAVYPSATEVNGTAINTGGYPANDGIVGNSEYRPAIDPLQSIHTEIPAGVRKGDRNLDGHYLKMPTIAELVRKSGRKTAVAAAKPIGLLPDRAERTTAEQGANFFAGSTLPENLLAQLTNALGTFPKDTSNEPTRNDWTTRAMIEQLWDGGVPAFSLLWLNQPDSSQHTTGPGSPQSLAAIRNADDNLGRVLQLLDKKGVRDSTDILIVSDHGCSTVAENCDLAAALQKAGINAKREFKTEPAEGEVLIVSNSGSTFVYVIGHQGETIAKIVKFLQTWDFTGVIFAKNATPGTFALSQIHLDSQDAPDIAVSLRWTAEKSGNGTPGMLVGDKTSFGAGQGAHCSLSPYDMSATLVAAGPSFHSGVTSTVPTGNVDVAPTILHLLGIDSKTDGRILNEALKGAPASVTPSQPRRIEALANNGGIIWRQYLKTVEVNGVHYIEEGNGSQTRPSSSRSPTTEGKP